MCWGGEACWKTNQLSLRHFAQIQCCCSSLSQLREKCLEAGKFVSVFKHGLLLNKSSLPPFLLFSLFLSLSLYSSPLPPCMCGFLRQISGCFPGLPLTLYEAEADFELQILPPPTPKCEDCRQYHSAWLRSNALILSELTRFPLHFPPLQFV